MKNGDIHQGTVAIERLTLKTPYGEIFVPYHQLLSLKISAKIKNKHGQLVSRLLTREGEIINGQLIPKELTIFRAVDVTLPLATADITEISFGSRGIQSSPPHFSPDIIKTNTGDRLLATILPKSFPLKLHNPLKAKNTLKTISYKDIVFIDIVLTEDDEQPRVQVLLHDGSLFQGETNIKNLQFKTHYGQNINLAINNISELRHTINSAANNVINTEEQKTDFIHRWKNKPKSLFQDHMVGNSLAPEMIKIPAGSFKRGDEQGDFDEKPITLVKIPAFAISVFEVTFDEYDLFCEETRREKPDDADWGRGDRPVINVTWKDAVAYTHWLSKRTRQNYRLPSDSEWEYATRARTQSKYWWGDEIGIANANCEDCKSLWDGYQSSPVGKFPANAFGLHDTAGNVFEWVADCWHDKFSEAPLDGSPIEKQNCGKRVIRGGAWSFPPKEIRSANRWRDFPSRRSDDTGFRIARSL